MLTCESLSFADQEDLYIVPQNKETLGRSPAPPPPLRLLVGRHRPHLVVVSYEPVADDGDGALPQRAAEHLLARVEHVAEAGERDERVQVEEDEAEHRHPQQRLACSDNTPCRQGLCVHSVRHVADMGIQTQIIARHCAGRRSRGRGQGTL